MSVSAVDEDGSWWRIAQDVAADFWWKLIKPFVSEEKRAKHKREEEDYLLREAEKVRCLSPEKLNHPVWRNYREMMLIGEEMIKVARRIEDRNRNRPEIVQVNPEVHANNDKSGAEGGT